MNPFFVGIYIFAYSINLSSVQRDMDELDAESSDHLTGRPSKLEDSTLDDNRRTCTHTHAHYDASVKSERPLGNRLAVRKYRAKKKAQNAYLEEEVKKLRALNRGLIRKLQFQATLEAEAVRLRSLLMDLKAKIGKELGVSSIYKQNCNISSYYCCSHPDQRRI